MINLNKYSQKEEEPKLGAIMENKIKWARENIPKWTKEKWEWLELLMENTHKMVIESNEKENIKKPKGRKKKAKPIDNKQTYLEKYMDLDN